MPDIAEPTITVERPEDAQSPAFWQAFLLSALGLAFKAPDALINPQFWAEDATVFFAEQRGHAWPRVFTPYASYLNTIQRLFAWVSDGFAAVHVPTLYCFGAWLIGALALVSLRQLRLAGVPFWCLLAGVIFTPTNGEVFGSLTNVQWLLQFYLLGSLARLARGERTSWLRIATASLVGLTGPFSIFAAVSGVTLVLASHSWARTHRAAVTPVRWNAELSALLLAALVQGVSVRLVGLSGHFASEALNTEAATRVLYATQLHAFAAEPFSPRIFAALVLALAIAPLIWLQDQQSRYLLLAMYVFVLLQVAGVVRKFSGDESRALMIFNNGDRYYVASKALLFWLLALLVVRVARSSLSLRTWVWVLAILAWLPFSWPQLQRQALPDLRWKELAAQLDAGRSAVIPVSPPGWSAHFDAIRKRH